MASAIDYKQKVEDFFVALNAADGDAMVDMYTEDGACWTSGRTLISGTAERAVLGQAISGVLDVFPKGLEFTVKGMTAEGTKVAVEAESHGEHVSGVIYHNKYHFLFIFEGEKLKLLKEYMDTELVTDIICGGARPES